MDFSASFLQAIQNEPLLPKGISPLVFLGSPYTVIEETSHAFLTILSGGTIEARDKYTFSLFPFDCRMLLYTKRGSGALRIPNKTYHLQEGTLLYLNCTSPPLCILRFPARSGSIRYFSYRETHFPLMRDWRLFLMHSFSRPLPIPSP